MINKRIKSSTLFPTGMIATFNMEGEQIGELQGAYSVELHKRILLEASDNAVIRGFDILPHGFVKHAKDFVEYWKTQDKAWEEIQELTGEVESKEKAEENIEQKNQEINIHQLKCILLIFEKELENATEGIGQAKWDANQLNEFYHNGKHEAFEIAVNKLKLFFETNNIEQIKSE